MEDKYELILSLVKYQHRNDPEYKIIDITKYDRYNGSKMLELDNKLKEEIWGPRPSEEPYKSIFIMLHLEYMDFLKYIKSPRDQREALLLMVNSGYLKFDNIKNILDKYPDVLHKMSDFVYELFSDELDDYIKNSPNIDVDTYTASSSIKRAILLYKLPNYNIHDLDDVVQANYLSYFEDQTWKLWRHDQPIDLSDIPVVRRLELNYIARHNFKKYIKIFEQGLDTLEDFEQLLKKNPENVYSTPSEIFEKYPSLIKTVIDIPNLVFDFLPKSIRETEYVQETLRRRSKVYFHFTNRDAHGYNINWTDYFGNLIEFFTLSNGYKIKSKEEYMKLVELYISSETSVPLFCEYYGINEPDGFMKLLKRAGDEDMDLECRINSIKQEAVRKFIAVMGDLAEKFNKNEITFKEYLSDLYRPSHKIRLIYEKIEDKSKFLMQIANYIKESKENAQMDKLLSLFECNIEAFPMVLKNTCDYNVPELRKTYIELSKTYKSITKYNNGYNRFKQLRTIKTIDKEVVVDDKIIDQALAYIKDNELYLCEYTVSTITEKIALGQIDYEKETNERKKALKESINKMIYGKKFSSIDEYIEDVKKHR